MAIVDEYQFRDYNRADIRPYFPNVSVRRWTLCKRSSVRSFWEPLSAESIRDALVGVRLVRDIIYLPSVKSTNTLAHELASKAAPHATLIVTDHQTAGRGRKGRAWYMPPCAALAMSFVVRPDLAPRQAHRLTMLAGVAVVEGIEQVTNLNVGLKWPNDVVVAEKKIGGILSETSISAKTIDYAVIGIGLNVNVDFADEPELASTASSLMLQLGHKVDRLRVLVAVVKRFDAHFDKLNLDGVLGAAWSQRLVTLGQRIEARTENKVHVGLAEATDDDGALLLRDDDGKVHRLLAADVTLRKKT